VKKINYKQQLKNMDKNTRKVKEMQEQIYGKKKEKVKMTVNGYYTDDNGFWTIYKTESGMTVMKKDKKNVH
jgi:hypothetical protein